MRKIINIHPIKLDGIWDYGYALDVHTIKSTFLGNDPYNNPIFNTERSELGELLYGYKYSGKHDYLSVIVETVADFMNSNANYKNIDLIMPVPPTKKRRHQPTKEIAEAVANELGIFYVDNVLVKKSSVQAKDLNALDREKRLEIIKVRDAVKKHSILLLDDLYDTGATLTACTRALRSDPLVDKIYVLAITKTKGNK